MSQFKWVDPWRTSAPNPTHFRKKYNNFGLNFVHLFSAEAFVNFLIIFCSTEPGKTPSEYSSFYSKDKNFVVNSRVFRQY